MALALVRPVSTFQSQKPSHKRNGEYVYARAAESGRPELAARESDCSDSTGALTEVHADWKE
jgi:hypothetical protein